MYHKAWIYAIFSIVLCGALSIIVSGCGEKGANFAPTAVLPTSDDNIVTDPTTTTVTLTTPITLEWDEPTTYTDGSTLDPANDLLEYRIYISAQSGVNPSDIYYPVSAPATSITITEINSQVNSQPSGTYYFVVTAVDITNMESAISNEVDREIQ